MIKMRSDKFYKHIKKELGTRGITPKLLLSFCKDYNYSCCIVKYNEDGLYLIDSDNNMCILDFLGEFVEGTGIFKQYENSEDNVALYKTIDQIFNDIDNGIYDIVYVNDPTISIRRI